MGLDVYVGSFTRYYAHDWETVVQQAGRLQGFEANVVRSQPAPDDQITDPSVINATVIGWRTGLNTALRGSGVISNDVDWDERVDAPYFTDKPAWDCYGALNLLAAYTEDLKPFPEHLSKQWPDDDRLVRRTNVKGSRYSHLYGCEVWLPSDLPNTFEGPRPSGQPARFGSSVRLLEHLQQLNDSTYRGSDADLAQWRHDMPDDASSAFEPKAKTGLAIMLTLTAASVDHSLPMLLDY